MSRRKGETTYKETAFGIIPRSKLIPFEIEGIDRAWRFVLDEIHSGTQITSTLLKEIHRIGFAWIFPEMGGRFRRIDVEVSHYRPPEFFRVPQLMRDFTEDLKERLKHLPSIDQKDFLSSLIELLAWAHHRFLWVHPFQDYNGRIARLLSNVILLKLGLPPIELKVETKSGRIKYIRALQEADRGNLKKLETLIAEAIEEAIEQIKKSS